MPLSKRVIRVDRKIFGLVRLFEYESWAFFKPSRTKGVMVTSLMVHGSRPRHSSHMTLRCGDANRVRLILINLCSHES